MSGDMEKASRHRTRVGQLRKFGPDVRIAAKKSL
jgi:hypothetical protein